MLNNIITWLTDFFSNKDTSSMKRLGYFLAIVFSVIWLSIDLLINKSITPNWNSAFLVFMTTAGGAYVGSKGLELFSKKPPVTPVEEEELK